MWKWVLGLVVVGVLLCAGALGAGGWYFWNETARRAEAARVEAEAARAAAEADAATMRQEVARDGHLEEARAALAAGDHARAEAAYTAVLDADPTSAEALIGRGRSYARLDRLDLAERDLREVTRLDPSRPDAWESYAWVLARAGRDAEAVVALDRLLALTGTDPKALRDRANARYRVGDIAGATEDARQACALGLPDGCALGEKIAAATRR